VARIAKLSEDDFFGGLEAAHLGGDNVIADGRSTSDEFGYIGETIVKRGKNEKHVISDILRGAKVLDDAFSCG